jgi:flagellar motor protein MotB
MSAGREFLAMTVVPGKMQKGWRQVLLAASLGLMTLPAAAAERTAAPVTADAETPPAALHESLVGATVERQLPLYVAPERWAQDPELYGKNRGDRIETQQVQEQVVKTIKLPNVVKPIYFKSGVADIPDHYVELLRDVLDSMKGRRNVRLHFVGHSDNARIYGPLKDRFGDNVGLSRERAGTAAEFFQKALGLPPESISYEGMGESQPIASNATEAGKARNRRVEVQVWYDELEERTVEKQVVVSEKLNRIKVCRVETVCKLTYKEGHARRTRVKNLVPPLHYSGEAVVVSDEFRQQVLQALGNLSNKQNVVVKLVAYTDDTPLTGFNERIYANHLGLSKAQARRAALALQDALKLPTAMIESNGRGNTAPVASNESESGRALNRRVEVEFWYDDLLQELPDEPQLCPEAAAAETVTRVYEPPTGPIKPVPYENGQAQLADEYVERLRGILADVKNKANVRLRFVGYTNNERLDRRAAMVYGDDVGLSTARARHVMEQIQPRLGLADSQVEFEGRGYVQSDDVVNAGFVESAVSRVDVQVVYDELATMDDLDAVDIQRLTREIDTANPYSLNLMRITVDGKPVDDPNVGVPDVQRCTDVALDKADVQFKFDNLERKPRLNVTAWPNRLRFQDDASTDTPENHVRFRIYSNYPAFIDKAEVRIFEAGKSLRDTPLAVVPVDKTGRAEWAASFDSHEAPGRTLQYVVRVYDKDGRFDETSAQTLWVLDKIDAETLAADAEKELLVGYGENRLAQNHIPLNGGTVKVYGAQIPAGRNVFVAGRSVPVAANGEFAVEEILPSGLHTVEVAVLDAEGNGELFLRDLALEKSDWFYVAIADITASQSDTNGPAELVTQDSAHYDNDLSVDGRLAFYTHGKFGKNWELTASADTLDGPVEDLFSNFMQKSPDALFRRIDPDYYFPTYGDDSTVEEGAPTLGKFYIKLRRDDDYGLWGNFKLAYTDNSLAHVDRALYGGNAHYQSEAVTSFGEKRFVIDGFAADPGTVAGRDEFRGTGGSLYYLRHQDILTGSERVRIEVRDKISGMVLAVKNLAPAQDYDIDYLQGRILLSEPLSPTSADALLVSSEAGGGNEVYLVTRYEYSTSFDEPGNLSTGGRLHYWLGDFLKIGFTGNNSDEAGESGSLSAGDITLRKSAATWFKAELSNSTGSGSSAFLSNDGGFDFASASNGVLPGDSTDVEAGASRFDASIGFSDIKENAEGSLTAYQQTVDAGYSAPGLITAKDTEQIGASLQTPLTEQVGLRAKFDSKTQQQGLDTDAAELNVDYKLNENWKVSSGLRQESRADNSPLVPLTQVEGDRTDAVLRGDYDSRGRWTAYGYVQDTLEVSGNQDDNGRVGAGGSWRFSDRFRTHGEASAGDMGLGAKAGTEYLVSDRTNVYMNYGLENERSDNGMRAQRGNFSSGFKTHYSDTTSVYLEEKYTHGDVPTGLTHATGVDLAPNDRWNYGASLDVGTLRDNLTGAEMERRALGLKMGYASGAVKLGSAMEFRIDNRENPDLSFSERQTWLTKNSLKYQVTDDWRFIGKLNYSQSKSSMGEFYDGSFTELVAGYGYRPVTHDRLNALVKYTYFYNLPSTDQVTIVNTAAEFIQKSHIVSMDTIYDLTPRWSLGGKYAYRLGQVSQDRVNPEFFDSNASLYIVRADWHVLRRWDATVEGRLLELPEAGDTRSGALVGVYRHLNDYIKFGAGYNFTNFSDDLTDLSYDNQGFFINLVGKL